MRAPFLAFALLLAACGQSESVLDQIERRDAEAAAAAQQRLDAAQRFLDEQRARPGVTATASGLLYEVVTRGANQNLPHPGRDAIVLVHYHGSLPNGDVFDSSIERGEPVEFPVEGVIPGFAEAIQLMRPGDTFMAYIPPDIGYGERGSPPAIPGNSPLVFRIQLLEFRTLGGQVVRAPRTGR